MGMVAQCRDLRVWVHFDKAAGELIAIANTNQPGVVLCTSNAKRLLDVLDKQLAQHKFVAGDEYTIADMAIWPWFGNVVLGGVYDAAEFLDAGSYKHVQRWAKEVGERPAVKRGRIVNRTNGPLNEQLHERHDASDFETNTEDKRQG